MSELLQDLRFGLRTLRKTPAFTLAAIATLALGIGATTAIFSTVNAALLRPLPYPRGNDIHSLRTRFTDGNLTSGLLAGVELTRLNDPNLSVLRAAGTQRIDAVLLRNDGVPVPAAIYGVTEGFFDVFGLPMTLGRTFTHDEHVGPGPPVVIMSHRVWRQLFGADPNIVGARVRLAETAMTVVGVAGRDFDVPQGADFWANGRINPQSTAHVFDAYMRTRAGTSPERLRNELATVMAGLARDYPGPETNRDFVVTSLVGAIVGDLGPTLVVVLAATALLLILACVNVANLLLARSAVRAREVAVRAALGATRGRIVRQLLTESALLALAGTIAGLFLAYGGIRVLLVIGAAKLPRLAAVPFDANVLLFALAALAATALLLGLAPAVRLATTDIKTLMNESGRSSTGGRTPHRVMAAMIVAEIAVAIILVAGAGWLIRSFTNLRTSDPGFASSGRVIVDLVLPFQRYRDPAQTAAWSRDLYGKLRGLGGIVGVGATSSVPLRADRDATPLVQIHGEAGNPLQIPVVSRMRIVSAGFFDAMGIRVLSGRGFTDDDRRETAPVAVVNQTFVRRFLKGQDPARTLISYGFPTVDPKTRRPVVGVVGDVRYASLSLEPEPALYLVETQVPLLRRAVVVATSRGDAAQLVPAIRDVVRNADPLLAAEFQSMPDLVASALSRQQLGTTLMMLFGAIALALAAVGIYGVIAYASAQRSGEVATRMALGATPTNIFWMMIGQGRTLAAAGVILGVAGAYATGRLASSWLYQVRAADPVILTLAVGLVLAVTVCATLIPARRAARIVPARALRSE
jgi:putative ABC transport system permease protein